MPAWTTLKPFLKPQSQNKTKNVSRSQALVSNFSSSKRNWESLSKWLIRWLGKGMKSVGQTQEEEHAYTLMNIDKWIGHTEAATI